MAIHKLTRRKALGVFGALPLGVHALPAWPDGAKEPCADLPQKIALLPGGLSRFALRGELNIIERRILVLRMAARPLGSTTATWCSNT